MRASTSSQTELSAFFAMLALHAVGLAALLLARPLTVDLPDSQGGVIAARLVSAVLAERPSAPQPVKSEPESQAAEAPRQVVKKTVPAPAKAVPVIATHRQESAKPQAVTAPARPARTTEVEAKPGTPVSNDDTTPPTTAATPTVAKAATEPMPPAPATPPPAVADAPLASPPATSATTSDDAARASGSPAAVAGAPGAAERGAGRARDNSAYFAEILERLNRFKRYPAELRKEKIEGRVVMKFTIEADGRVVAASVARTSGHEELDQAAREMLASASPLPAIPAAMHRAQLTLSVPVEYSLLTER